MRVYGQARRHATASELRNSNSCLFPLCSLPAPDRNDSPPLPPQNPIDTPGVPGENRRIPPLKPIAAKCKHPQVRVVARDEDTEFVECQHCGEVFDAIEYRDMILEEEETKRLSTDPAEAS